MSPADAMGLATSAHTWFVRLCAVLRYALVELGVACIARHGYDRRPCCWLFRAAHLLHAAGNAELPMD
jgi:hypothetical protein